MNNSIYIELISKTSTDQPDELFDYHSRNHLTGVFKVIDSGCIYRSNNYCYIREEYEIPGVIGLIKIERRGDEFLINALEQQISDRIWRVINEIPHSRGYRLKEGDFLRLGEVSLRIKKICFIPEEAPSFPASKYLQKSECEEIKQEHNFGILNESAFCRICLENVDTPNDPLFSPCGCTGTMKSIHLLCLKQWIYSKTSLVSSTKCQSFNLGSLRCELCGFDLPISFKYNEKLSYLLQFQTPINPYIIFEEFRLHDSNHYGLHYLNLRENQSGTIGRGSDCDLRIIDKTVSRIHCQIKCIKGEFYIKDCKSRFGTLAKVSETLVVGSERDVTIQIDKSIFRIFYRQPINWCKICTCFFKKKKSDNELKLSRAMNPVQEKVEERDIHTIMNDSYKS